ncbi:hypothetical protein BDL97_08G083200 [Sphagnum fallax]|nr:hypothetical protein BDL97_08G083200 [Sphagnum fallax]
MGNIPGANFLIRAAQHFGGGGVARAVATTVMYPLDTIKTRMQAQSNLEGEEPQYKDEIDYLKQLFVKEGPASLYSGLVPQLLSIAPEAMKLTVNEMLLGVLEIMMPGARIWLLEFRAGLYRGAGITRARDVPSSAIIFTCYTLLQQLYPNQNFMPGCLATIPVVVLVTPMDIIKTCLQKEPTPGKEPYRDWLQCLQLLIEREGPQALFKGSLVWVIRMRP